MELIKRAWKGEEKLWKVFWLYGVLAGIVLNLLLTVLIGNPLLAKLILLPYSVWVLVSLWRCAWNAGAKFWGVIARILVVINIISYVFALIGALGILALGGSLPTDAVKAPVPVSAAPSAAPVTAPAAPAAATPSAPVPAAVAAPAAPTESYAHPCEKMMADYAVKNGADPKAYIAQNQAYLAQCKQQTPVTTQ